MKILYVHQHFNTPKGSGGLRPYMMAMALVEQGHDVTVVCGSSVRGGLSLDSDFKNGFRTGVINRINIIEFDLPYSNNDSFQKRIKTFLRFSLGCSKIALKQDYDLIFCSSTPLTTAIPGIIGKLFRKKKFVFEVRDLWPDLPISMGIIKNKFLIYVLKKLESYTYKKSDHLIGLSPGMVDGIKNRSSKDKPVSLIPNGCDLAHFQTDESWRPDNIPPDNLLAIYTGAHGLANGLDWIVEAAVHIPSEYRSKISILLVGQGSKKSSLIEKSKKLGVEDVVFFHDPISKEGIEKLMASADIGLQILENNPDFYYGTSPNKFFDYLSAGLPVITNYPGWVKDLLKLHNCGFHFDYEEKKEFANKLIYLSENKEILKPLGMNSRKLAETNFDRKVLSKKFVDVLEHTVDN